MLLYDYLFSLVPNVRDKFVKSRVEMGIKMGICVVAHINVYTYVLCISAYFMYTHFHKCPCSKFVYMYV